jgi:TPP-dependent indolepyruvate ferredoxin oxidoreductase alpha subunit
MMLQRQADEKAGLNTAGFITGYRGSPLGNVDLTASKAKKYLEKAHVKFHPGVNEDLAATSVWGTQQVNLFPERNTTACLRCGTAKARVLIAAVTCLNMRIWPAHRNMVVYWSLPVMTMRQNRLPRHISLNIF